MAAIKVVGDFLKRIGGLLSSIATRSGAAALGRALVSFV